MATLSAEMGRRPRSDLDTICLMDAQAATLAWKITAVGNRPRDHVGRDLVVGSWQWDHRLRSIRDLHKDTPAWMIGAISHPCRGHSESWPFNT